VLLRRVALVKTDVLEERITASVASTANVSSSPILVAQLLEARRSSETSAFTRTTRYNISEDSIRLRLICLRPFIRAFRHIIVNQYVMFSVVLKNAFVDGSSDRILSLVLKSE
jgi:hypothetical protein